MDYNLIVGKIVFIVVACILWNLLKWSLRTLKQKLANRKSSKSSKITEFDELYKEFAGPYREPGFISNKYDNWSQFQKRNPFH